MDALLSPEGGLAALTLASFVAATLVPLSSEAVLFGYLKLHPNHAGIAVALATLGNTAGGMTSYLLGRIVPARVPDAAVLERLRRYGAPVTFLAWLPIVGDALCVAAGWLRVNWLAALVFMAAGRFLRYWAIAQGVLA